MQVLDEKGKLEYLGKNLLEQRRKPTKATHITTYGAKSRNRTRASALTTTPPLLSSAFLRKFVVKMITIATPTALLKTMLKITIFDSHWVLITITIAMLVRTRLNVTWNPSKGKNIIKTIDRFHEWRPKNYSFVYVLIRPTSLAGALYTKSPVTSLRSKGIFLLHFVRANEASRSN